MPARLNRVTDTAAIAVSGCMPLVVVVSIVVSVLSDAHCKKRIYGANGDSKTAGNCEQM
jgi:cobalamin synthase